MKIPITNVYAKGGYCAQLHLGANKEPVNVILDTGSSTLAINKNAYQAQNDAKLTTTNLAQQVTYPLFSWSGPIINTLVKLKGNIQESMVVENCSVALASSITGEIRFAEADGILGLAYSHLNKSYNLSSLLNKNKKILSTTYPWRALEEHIENAIEMKSVKDFKAFIKKYPNNKMPTFFETLSEQNTINNKFAFHVKRSSIHISKNNQIDKYHTQNSLTKDPLNQGWFILGGGEEYRDLYQGKFQSIKVNKNTHYWVSLNSMRVGKYPKIEVLNNKNSEKITNINNAIIDTGCSAIVLSDFLYNDLINTLQETSPAFIALLSPFKDIEFQEKGIDMNELKLNTWPDLTFNFAGEKNTKSQEVSIVCKPQHYWQINTPSFGKACFKIIPQLPNWPNQSIFGLPLISDYFVIFDRAKNNTGVIKFAQQKAF